jgi:RES domain-containing protein
LSKNIPVFRFTGIVYRAHHPKWAFEPLSGNGAKRYGGRFNRPETTALYTSLDPTTAWMEAQQGFPFKPQPMTLLAYEVDCANIVNLHEPDTLNLLGYSRADLACAWEDLASLKQEPPTWKLADQLRELNISGIQCRSFAPGCTEQSFNLVLWEWSDSLSDIVRVIDDFGRLPESKNSWEDGV